LRYSWGLGEQAVGVQVDVVAMDEEPERLAGLEESSRRPDLDVDRDDFVLGERQITWFLTWCASAQGAPRRDPAPERRSAPAGPAPD
jgi:hypothetical protein